jgi:hypothetical protein
MAHGPRFGACFCTWRRRQTTNNAPHLTLHSHFSFCAISGFRLATQNRATRYRNPPACAHSRFWKPWGCPIAPVALFAQNFMPSLVILYIQWNFVVRDGRRFLCTYSTTVQIYRTCAPCASPDGPKMPIFQSLPIAILTLLMDSLDHGKRRTSAISSKTARISTLTKLSKIKIF